MQSDRSDDRSHLPLARLCGEAREHLGAETAVTLWSVAGEGLRLRAQEGYAAAFLVARPALGVAGRASATGRRQGSLESAATDPAHIPAREDGIAAAAVPLGAAGALGALAVESTAVLPPETWEVLERAAIKASALLRAAGASWPAHGDIAGAHQSFATCADRLLVARRMAELLGALNGLDAVQVVLLDDQLAHADWAGAGHDDLLLPLEDLRALAERLRFQPAASTGAPDGARPPGLEALLAEGRGFVGLPLRGFDGLRGYVLGRTVAGARDLCGAIDASLTLSGIAAAALSRLDERLRSAEHDRALALAGALLVHGRLRDDGQRRLDPGTRIERLVGHVGRSAGAADPLLALAHPDDADAARRAVDVLRTTGESTIEYRVVREDGRTAHLRERAWLEPRRGPGAFVAIVVDASPEQETASRLRDAEEMNRSVIETMTEGVVVQDALGRIVSWNASAERILGLSADELAGRTSIDPRWRAVRPDGSHFAGEEHPAMVTLRTGLPQRDVPMGIWGIDGQLRWISVSTEPRWRFGEPTPHGVVATFADVTEARATAVRLRDRIAELEMSAGVDAQTGLANAASLRAAAAAAIGAAAARGRSAALVVIDIDGLDDVNDLSGWEAGDDALRTVAAAVLATAPPDARVGRMGGDELAVLLDDAGELHAVAEALRAAVAGAGLRAGSRPLTACVGAAPAGRGKGAGDLLGAAHAALRRAKRAGLDRCEVIAQDGGDGLGALPVGGATPGRVIRVKERGLRADASGRERAPR